MAHSETPEDQGPYYSVIVPFYNEDTIVEKLHNRLVKVMNNLGKPYELIYVDDGSRDSTPAVLERIAEEGTNVLSVMLRRNFGQTTALQAGFDTARGEVIIAMDGDLQHDPYEIPLFIAKIEEGYDIASGWRVRRGDNFLMRRLPSKMANLLLAKVSGIDLHDFGTTFKAYRREVLEDVRLYGEMHRFVPAVCARLGAKICEVPIKNVRRAAGTSNYGISRTFRVALDLITLKFITGYLTRPLHFFGKWGFVSALLGGGVLFYGLIRKIWAMCTGGEFSLFAAHGPLMALGFMLIIVAMMFLATGVMGELLMRIYFESTNARTYSVRHTFGRDDEEN
jgi:glycosyltransferase involved in cell wall biosynthesis